MHRRPRGLVRLLALAAIALSAAVIGYGLTDRSRIDAGGPTVAGPSLAPSASMTPPVAQRPGAPFAPLAILRNGGVATLNGDLPDAAARTALLDMLDGVYGDRVRLVDNLTIKPGASTPEVAALGTVFTAALPIPDFKFRINGDAITLIGTAGSETVRSAVQAAAKAAWPNLKIANEIRVSTAVPESPGPAGGCGNLQAGITEVMQTPVAFLLNGYTLTAGAQQELSRAAEKIKGCPDARVAVNGYTDDTGDDAVNIPLSANRAKAVAEFLVSRGVPADHVTSKGFGPADPVAANTTPEGRAQNRRVTITVN